MPWTENRYVNKESRISSRYIITFSGMHIRFEICCVWLVGKFKWMLNSEQLGIHANLLGYPEAMSSEQAKKAALELIRNKLIDNLQEVELQLEDFE